MTRQSPCSFDVEFSVDHRVAVVSVRGKLDPVAVDELNPLLEETYRTGVRRFVFDLSGLEYAGSLALRLFVGLHNRVKGEGAVVLSNASRPVRDVMEMTRVNQILRQYPSRAEAIDATLM